MIRTRVYRDGKCVDENFDPARISDHLETDDCIVWCDLEAPQKEDLALLAEEFNLNPLAVEDATQERQRPKVDHYDDHLFVSLYDVTLDPETGELHSHELAVFAAPRYLVTVRKSAGYSIDPVVARWDENKELAKYGVPYLLWGVLDVIVDGHFEAVQSLDDRADQLENLLFEPHGQGTEVQRESFELRKSLVRIRRVVLPTREVLNALMRRGDSEAAPTVPPDLIPYYQDVYDHVLRAADWTDSLRDLVSTILETNLTIQGNQMNLIMKKLTSWAAIAAIPTVVTGYYGMNVLTYPHSGTRAGGYVALAIPVLAVIFLYAFFRKRDWL